MKIALAGIVKNEFPYLLEWIAHHINIGVDHFIIANHGSTDGTTELLEALQKLGIVTTFFISAETEAPQLAAYKKILEDYGKEYDWMGFLDADEFFVPEAHISLKQILTNKDKRIGGVLFNWAIYGSSFQKSPDHFELPSPVTARFTWRASKEFEVNRYTKCFMRPEAVALDKLILYNDPHRLCLNNGWYYINSDFKQIEDGEGVSWGNGRINHYVIKSNAEFSLKKMPNGSAACGNDRYKDWLYFQLHDLNDVFEPMPLYLQHERDIKINYLKKELQKSGYKYPLKQENERPESQGLLKDIESVEIIDNEIIVKGWVMDYIGRSVATELELLLKSEDGKYVTPSKFIITKNEQARKINPHSSLRNGLKVCFPLINIKKKSSVSIVLDYANKEQKILDINLDNLRKNYNRSIFSKIISPEKLLPFLRKHKKI